MHKDLTIVGKMSQVLLSGKNIMGEASLRLQQFFMCHTFCIYLSCSHTDFSPFTIVSTFCFSLIF